MIAITPPKFQPEVGLRPSSRWLTLDPLAILPPLTVLHLLVHAPHAWYLGLVLIPLFALGLIFRPWLTTPPFWYVTAMLLGTTIYFNWESSDNHKYLFVYWCLALCSTFSLPRSQWSDALARTSRLLIALCMILATLWKVATPEYMDGRFFTYELLTDDRFANFAQWTTGVTAATLALNHDLRSLLTSNATGWTSTVQLSGAEQVAPLAMFLTWWTVLIEGLIGLLFLFPAGKWTNRIRNGLLTLFAATTYSVAPVRGFGWMLMLLGLAQCPTSANGPSANGDEQKFRWGYLAGLLLIQAYMLPLGELIRVCLR